MAWDKNSIVESRQMEMHTKVFSLSCLGQHEVSGKEGNLTDHTVLNG